MQKIRKDELGENIIHRVQNANDLVAAEAKYHRTCGQSFFKFYTKEEKVDYRQEAFHKLCEFLDGNDECQYSLQELSDYMETFLDGKDGYGIQYLKTKLREHYGDDIVLTSIPGKSTIVSFHDLAHKILNQQWNDEKCVDKLEERDRILDMAASIIRNDIRMSVYNCELYNTMDSVNVEEFVPHTLNRFLHKVIDSKSSNHTTSNRRCTSIAHAIISASRPRSFGSPLLLGVSIYIHRRYASRELIDLHSSLSFADDYKEVQRFEQCLLSDGNISYNFSGFTQFIFNNADFNVSTLTGKNTFHSMGGIACITPPGSVNKSPIKRNVKLQSSEIIGTFGQIPIKMFEKPAISGLQSVTVQSLNQGKAKPQNLHSAFVLDDLWMSGYIFEISPCPSWSGFMKSVMHNEQHQYERSRIVILPFINLDPGNLSTIYSALSFVKSID